MMKETGGGNAICQLSQAKTKSGIKIIRIFNTYGPRMHPQRRARGFQFHCSGTQGGRHHHLWRLATQTRSFQYVDDLIEGMIRMMNTREDFTGPVNLGNPVEFTIRELAEKIIRMTNSRSKIVRLPIPPDDPMQRQPDIRLAKKELDWGT